MTLGSREEYGKTATTHLSQMGQEGNALDCFTKAHFICKNAINTLEKRYIHGQNLSLSITVFNLLSQTTNNQNVKLVQTKVTRNTHLNKHYYPLQ